MGLETLKERKEMIIELKAIENIINKDCFKVDSLPSINALADVGDLGKVLRVEAYMRDYRLSLRTVPLEIQFESIRLPTLTLKSSNDYNDIVKEKEALRTLNEAIRSQLDSLRAKKRTVQERLLQCRQHVDPMMLQKIAKSEELISEEMLDKEAFTSEILIQSSVGSRERLEKIPVGPGFSFSSRNVCTLIDEKQNQLEEMKSEVLRLAHAN